MRKRTIKSFVLRAGRTSNRQQLGLNEFLSNYELKLEDGPWNFEHIFGRNADTVVEIGFGMGASLVEMAKNNPQTNFIGIEVHRPGVGSLVADIHELALDNVRVVIGDAVDIFTNNISESNLAGVHIFFPDPWPKKKHHKRRLVQPDFVSLIAKKMKAGGYLHCATDWEDYAQHMLTVLNSSTLIVNKDDNGGYYPRPESRPVTKFEKRGIRLGHGVWDLLFTRNA